MKFQPSYFLPSEQCSEGCFSVLQKVVETYISE